jgi:hypothetical protein
MIQTPSTSFETFDDFVLHVDGVLQAAAGANVVAFDLEHGRSALWRRGRFRIRMWPTKTGVVVMIELDESYRDDFREWRTREGADELGERLAELLGER